MIAEVRETLLNSIRSNTLFPNGVSMSLSEADTRAKLIEIFRERPRPLGRGGIAGGAAVPLAG
ncbi:MAG: hypothetical protein QG599_1896, partial [Pseudomonadota bacterium]|nr:hypothetical protein [Pseudomonadota bacterium]